MVNHKRYITRKRARIEGICGKVNIPYGTALETKDGYLLYEGSRLCVVTSQNAYDYFSQDDDGHGLERGGLVAAILARLEKRDADHQRRWDKVWENPFCLRYKRPDCEDFFIWGYDFYNAPIDDLKAIAEIVGCNPSTLDRARR